MNYPKKQRGFTLIELVMVILLISILAVIASQMLMQGLSALLSSRQATDANWQGQIALEQMARDIRSLRSASDITILSASELAFTDMNGNSIDYKRSGSALMQGTHVTADHISSLSFAYYDKNGNSTASSSSVAYVKIALSLTQNTLNYSLGTGIYLRDLSS